MCRLCYNYFQSNATDVIPMFRGIPLHDDEGASVKIVNFDLRKDRKDLLESNTNHINIDKNVKLHAVLGDDVLEDLSASKCLAGAAQRIAANFPAGVRCAGNDQTPCTVPPMCGR